MIAKDLLVLLARQIRMGYISVLFLPDLAAILLIGRDLLVYESMGLSFKLAIRIVPQLLSGHALRDGLALFLTLTLGLPFICSFPKLSQGSLTNIEFLLRRNPKRLAFLHIAVSAVITFSVFVLLAMQVTSGYSGVGLPRVYDYGSLFYGFASRVFRWDYITWLFTSAIVVALFAEIAAKATFQHKEVRAWLDRHAERLTLSDFDWSLSPVYGTKIVNVNGGIAPELREVRSRTSRSVLEFQRRVAGSQKAKQYMEEEAEKCRRLLSEVAFEKPPQLRHVEFYSTTSRALEAILERLQKMPIVLSPYEHPSEIAVANWVGALRGVPVHHIKIDGKLLNEKWETQVEAISSNLGSLNLGEEFVLVLSDVCFATGAVIPIENLVRKLTTGNGWKISLVVDGAHSVGNRKPIIPDCIAYILSSHKWLMSPEPCGICLTDLSSPQPYDAWLLDAPIPATVVRPVAALKVCLEILKGPRLNTLRVRSEALRKAFERMKPNGIRIIGAKSDLIQSSILSVAPAPGYEWEYEADGLKEYLANQGVNATVIDFYPASLDAPWIRLAFSFFLDAKHIESLSKVLNKAVKNKILR